MKAYQATYPIATMCRVLGVSESGYHAWRTRARSEESCGAPRLLHDLRDIGERVGQKRIARLMRQAQPVGVSIEFTQDRAIAFGHRCEVLGVRPSMGSRGDAYDNAMAESFFSTLDAELLAKHRFEQTDPTPTPVAA